MTRRLLSGALLLTLAACGNSEATRDVPPTLDSDLPDRVTPVDVTPDRTTVDVRDAGGPDVATDTPPVMDAPVDVAPTDVQPVDVAPVDATPGAPFCDLPGGIVTGAVVPAGFCIRRYARVRTPRVIKFAPNGDLFVSSPSTGTPGGSPIGLGAILVLPDDDHDGQADSTITFASGLDGVHGLLFPRGSDQILFTLDDGLYALPYRAGLRTSPTAITPSVVADLTGWVRWTHTLAQQMDGSILVSMGQHDFSTCPVTNQRGGSVLRVRLPTTSGGGEIVARGFRNPMYINCMPWGSCYAAELSGDGWDSIGGREKLVELHNGDDYGYPCCVDRGMVVPGTPAGTNCASVAESVQTYTLHDTPFGFDWEPGRWPGMYANGFFVGLHGYVGSWTNTGVQWAPVDPTTHRPTRATVPFVSGWGLGQPIPGRVADLQFAPDGRMFFTDDQDGAIYWVAPTDLRMPAH